MTSPEEAATTLVHNWAVKKQCYFVAYFTALTILSIYFGMRDHFNKSDVKWVCHLKLVFTILEVATLAFVIALYASLLYYFRKLLLADNQYLVPMKRWV